MDRFEEFESRINRSLANMDAKISYLHESTGQLKESFNEFQEDINEFMKYVAEHISDRGRPVTKSDCLGWKNMQDFKKPVRVIPAGPR